MNIETAIRHITRVCLFCGKRATLRGEVERPGLPPIPYLVCRRCVLRKDWNIHDEARAKLLGAQR